MSGTAGPAVSSWQDGAIRWLVTGSFVLALAWHVVAAETTTLAWLTACGFGLGMLAGRLAPGPGVAILAATVYFGPAMQVVIAGNQGPLGLAWSAVLAGLLAATWPGETPRLRRGWRVLLLGWALVVALTWPIIAAREADFSRTALWTSGLVNGRGLFPMTPSWAVRWVAAFALTQLLGLAWIDWLSARYRDRPREALVREVLEPMAAGAVAACALGCYQALVDINWLNFGEWRNTGRAVGPVLDGNVLGMLGAMWGPAIAMGMTRVPWPVRATAFVACWGGVVASGSRTALMVATTASAFLAWRAARHVERRWTWLAATVGVTVGVTLAIGALIGPRAVPFPVRRLVQDLPSLSPHAVAGWGRSLHARLGYGLAADDMIREFPLFGVGIGSYSMLLNDYHFERTGGLLPLDQAQNWWRQQVAELGLLGGAAPVVWSGVLLVSLLRRPRDADPQGTQPLLRVTVLAFGVCALVGTAYANQAMILTVWTFVVWLTRAGTSQGEHSSIHGRSVAVVVGLALLCAVGQYHQARDQLRPAYRAMRAGLQYGYGFQRGGVGADGEPFWWTGKHAVFVFPVSHQLLEFRAAVMHPDVTDHPVRVEVWLAHSKIVDREVRDHAPVVVRVPAVPGQRAILLDTRVGRLFRDGSGRDRGLQITKALAGLEVTSR